MIDLLHDIAAVLQNYFHKPEMTSFERTGNGHINDTFLVHCRQPDQSFILQRLNTKVFKMPEVIANNYSQLLPLFFNITNNEIRIPRLYFDVKDNAVTYDAKGNAWRLTEYIEDSHSIEVMDKPWQAKECGRAFGRFAAVCSQADPTLFQEAIPGFHSLQLRMTQLESAIEANRSGRIKQVQPLIDFYLGNYSILQPVLELQSQGEIPLRVVHNDTKINNLLFMQQKAVAVIDLDTVGPGLLLYDFGDAIRTITNTAAEDEPNTSAVDFNMDAFRLFATAYLEEIKAIITPAEASHLHLSGLLMTFIMGIRFLADYLNGDVYYKIRHPAHNLQRSLVQKAFIEALLRQQDTIKNIINENL